MKNTIKLFWYKHNEGFGNFGDELNPYIIGKLSGQKIQFININYFNLRVKSFLKSLTYSVWTKKMSFVEFTRYLSYYFVRKPKVVVAIGSVLQFVKKARCIIWGSGIISSDTTFSDAEFTAVRGKKTVQRLKELGYNVPEVIGDPALLLPLIYQSSAIKKYKVGIIPHLAHYQSLNHSKSDDTIVVNLLDPVEKVIEEICSCELTLSTSLHGIIVSHAYNIPSLWVNFKEANAKTIGGDDIKFEDYFSSVGIRSYTSINVRQDSLNPAAIIEEFSDYMLPKLDISILQKNLLKVAPFYVKKEYLKT